MYGIKDIISSLKKKKDEVFNDDKGWIRGGQFTPGKQVQQISNQATQYFNPTSNNGQNFWSGKGGQILSGQTNIPKVSLPRFNFNSANPVVNSALKIPQFVANLPSNFIEDNINIPSNYAQGIVRTGADLGQMARGQQLYSPFKLAVDFAPTANAMLNISTMGIGKQAIGNLGKQTLKQAVLSNAIPGAKLGIGFGGLSALENSRDKTFKQALPNIALSSAVGGIAGGVVGGGLGAAGYGLKKLFSDFTPQSTINNDDLKVKEPTQLKINDSRASSEVNVSPFEYAKNEMKPLDSNTKANAKYIFGDNQVPSSERSLGSAERLRTGDNPLLASQELVDHLNKIDVKKKANVIDYLRTPENVLKKFGMEKEMGLLRVAQDNYSKELKTEINRVSAWQKRVPDAESSKRIFAYLDGGKIKLDSQEQLVATEIKSYLNKWADRLDLPEESRITSYITHIFEKGDVEAEFNPDIAKMLDNKVSGSVFDPFTQKRTNTTGYVTDVWRALDAYVKRATRKVNFDPALDRVEIAANKLDLESYKYVQKYISGVNMRPTELDNLLDNTIKSVVGYKFGGRPTANITGQTRQTMSRAMLGLNPGSALRNLSQGANTYAVLGEKYTLKGYLSLAKNMATNNMKELYDNGVLDEGLVQDRSFHAVKSLAEKIDPVLYSLFQWAETVNRGSAYWGAKSKGLASGMSEVNAINYAKSVVRRTQFSFKKIDVPVALQSDLAKTALQFGSYSLKQAEFIGGLIKSKDYAAVARLTGSSLVFMATLGKLIGMKPEELIPSISLTPPVVQLGQNIANTYTSIKGGKAGQTVQNLMKTGAMVIPAGTQIKKAYEGLKAVGQGYSETPTGLVRFPVEQSTPNYIRGGLFGQWNLPEGQQYFKDNVKPLSEKQSQVFKSSSNPFSTYKEIMAKRDETRTLNKAKDQVRESGTSQLVGAKFIYLDGSDVKTISLDTSVPELKLTGEKELDKEVIKAYNSDVSAKIRAVTILSEHNQITPKEANTLISNLRTKKAKAYSSFTAFKLGKVPKIKRIASVKLKTAKKITSKASSIKAKKIAMKAIKPQNIKSLQASLRKILAQKYKPPKNVYYGGKIT